MKANHWRGPSRDRFRINLHAGVVSGGIVSGYREFDPEIDRGRGQKDYPNASDKADLLLIRGCSAAGEHNLRSDQCNQANDGWNRNVYK